MSLLRSNHQLGRSFARCLSSSSRCATHPTTPLDRPIDAAQSPIASHPHPAPVAPSPSPATSSSAPTTAQTSPFDTHTPPTASTSQASHYPHPQAPPSPSTHFGFKDVPEQLKESLVKGVFSSVASSYDVMNDAMSLGIHRLWKDHYVSKMDPHNGMRCLDVAGGTGDIAMRLLDHARTKYADRDVHVHILDINPEMLDEGRKRFAKSMYHGGPQVSFTLGNAEELSTIPDNSIDLYTIAFGIRNCTHIDRVLEQAHRVLKPGGVFSCLEFSKVSNPLLAKAYKLYSFQVIPTLGHVIASDRDSYQYLVESIERFPPQARFSKMIEEAGFTVPRREPWEDVTFGIAAIHTGVKL